MCDTYNLKNSWISPQTSKIANSKQAMTNPSTVWTTYPNMHPQHSPNKTSSKHIPGFAGVVLKLWTFSYPVLASVLSLAKHWHSCGFARRRQPSSLKQSVDFKPWMTHLIKKGMALCQPFLCQDTTRFCMTTSHGPVLLCRPHSSPWRATVPVTDTLRLIRYAIVHKQHTVT